MPRIMQLPMLSFTIIGFYAISHTVTCTGCVTLHIDQWVHVSLAQPLLVGLSITNTKEANSGVFEDQVGALIALRVKHPETRSRVTAKIGLQESKGVNGNLE